jgi:glycosyltransferase involved in cell wall biosynthesis
MKSPSVSFIVPCYKLAHLLRECIESVLSQTYEDFEVLIMDDCSPDHTADIASAFHDARIRYIRNEQNLGHLANYNKGISLSLGTYIWLISADDRLRRPYVLERYVALMENHPSVGYVFCPGIGFCNGQETGLLDYYYYGANNKIFSGPKFIAKVLHQGGGLLSPSVMVRRSCYEEISMFPLDMPHQGDMYLWFIWALEHQVAYLSEPMVNYRSHDLNMMTDLLERAPHNVFADEVNVLWRTKRKARQRGITTLNRPIECSLGAKYARAASFGYGSKGSPWGLSIAQCDQALRSNSADRSEYRRIRGRFYAVLGDKHWWNSAFRSARQTYRMALRDNWQMPEVWLKLLFTWIGPAGIKLRLYIRQRREAKLIAVGNAT